MSMFWFINRLSEKPFFYDLENFPLESLVFCLKTLVLELGHVLIFLETTEEPRSWLWVNRCGFGGQETVEVLCSSSDIAIGSDT